MLFRAPIDAIAYPSVMTEKIGMNFSFRPHRADALLYPAEAWEFEIVSRSLHPDTGKLLFKTRPLRRTIAVQKDGALVWGNDGAGVTERDLSVFSGSEIGTLSSTPVDVSEAPS